MTREEAMEFVVKAINTTWNEKTCKEILKALDGLRDAIKAIEGKAKGEPNDNH